jgi:hypothetical protein
VDFSGTHGEGMEVFVMGIGKVHFQTVFKGLGKRNDAVFAELEDRPSDGGSDGVDMNRN